MKFNPEKHYLGKPCKRGHEFENSGLALRYKKNRSCVACRQEYWASDKHRDARKRYAASDNRKDSLKKYNASDKGKQCLKKHYKSDGYRKRVASDDYKERQRKYQASDAGKRTKRNYNAKARLGLLDSYVKRQITNTTGLKCSEITPEMIELKREQLTMYRLIKEIKNGTTGTRD